MRQEATGDHRWRFRTTKLVNLGGTGFRMGGETDYASQTATSRLELIEPLMGEIYGNPQATPENAGRCLLQRGGLGSTASC